VTASRDPAEVLEVLLHAVDRTSSRHRSTDGGGIRERRIDVSSAIPGHPGSCRSEKRDSGSSEDSGVLASAILLHQKPRTSWRAPFRSIKVRERLGRRHSAPSAISDGLAEAIPVYPKSSSGLARAMPAYQKARPS